MSVNKRAAKAWLTEAARICRVAAGAPAVLLVIQWGGNSVLAILGRPDLLKAVDDPHMNLPSLILTALVYTVLSFMGKRPARPPVPKHQRPAISVLFAESGTWRSVWEKCAGESTWKDGSEVA